MQTCLLQQSLESVELRPIRPDTTDAVFIPRLTRANSRLAAAAAAATIVVTSRLLLCSPSISVYGL